METYAVHTDRRTRLGLKGRSVFAFGVLSLALPFSAWLASAATVDAPSARTVSYQVHDLTNAQGIERIYRNLQSAAHDVCADYDARGFSTARAHQRLLRCGAERGRGEGRCTAAHAAAQRRNRRRCCASGARRR